MKTILLSVIVFLIFTSAFAIIPGLNKTNFGASLVAEPFLTNIYSVNAYYMEGAKVYSYKDMFDLYLYTGLNAEVTYVGLVADGESNGLNASLGIPLRLSYPMYKFPFKLFGKTFIPTLIYQLELKYTFGKSFEFKSDDMWIGLYTKNDKNSNYFGFYLWPYPLIVGFDIAQF